MSTELSPLYDLENVYCLHANLKNKLVQSLQYLFDINKKHIKHFVEEFDFLKLLDSDVKIPAAFYALNSILLEATTNGSVHLIKPNVFSFCNESLKTNISYYGYGETEASKISGIFEKQILFDLSLGSSVAQPDLSRSLKMIELLKQALALIYKVDNAVSNEIEEFVSEFMIIQSNSITAGSSFGLFGLVFINEANSNCSPIRIAEMIIHEASHLYLYCISTDDSLVLNDYSEMFFSPIRGKNRPMIGIYHAAFVMARVLHFLRKVMRLDNLSSNELNETEKLIQSYTKIAFESLDIVKSEGKLSKKGRQIINYADYLIHTHL